MSTINSIDSSWIKKEIKDIKSSIDYYDKLYKEGPIKCIVLRRLIVIKRNELLLLENILKNRNNDRKK